MRTRPGTRRAACAVLCPLQRAMGICKSVSSLQCVGGREGHPDFDGLAKGRRSPPSQIDDIRVDRSGIA
jgi:hypothetical protein